MAKRKKKKVMLGLFILIAILIAVVVVLYINREKVADIPIINNIVEKIEEPPKKVQVIDLESNTRPFAVMINNNSAVWKYQSGLNDAYIVYEMLVEGGITREMAVFKGANVPKIQSVRSSRHYFLDYALENDAVYVHWGWSPQAQSDISSLKINNINGLTYEGTYFFRDSTIKGIGIEHKGYTSSESINKAIANLKYRSTTEAKPLLKYDVDSIDMDSIPDVQNASYVEVKFSGYHTSKWYYDEDTKVYKKKQNSTDMIDYNSNKPFTAKNIITYQIGYSGIPGDTYGRLNASNIGNGSGYYITEGKAVPIKWSKSSRSEQTKYTLEDGTELTVNDGNTYIEIQPKGQSIKISEEIPE